MEANRPNIHQMLNSALRNLNQMADAAGLDRLNFAVKAANDVVNAMNEAQALTAKIDALEAKVQEQEASKVQEQEAPKKDKEG